MGSGWTSSASSAGSTPHRAAPGPSDNAAEIVESILIGVWPVKFQTSYSNLKFILTN